MRECVVSFCPGSSGITQVPPASRGFSGRMPRVRFSVVFEVSILPSATQHCLAWPHRPLRELPSQISRASSLTHGRLCWPSPPQNYRQIVWWSRVNQKCSAKLRERSPASLGARGRRVFRVSQRPPLAALFSRVSTLPTQPFLQYTFPTYVTLNAPFSLQNCPFGSNYGCSSIALGLTAKRASQT